MARFVLRYTGTGPVPASDVDRVRMRARVVDAHGRTLLVEGSRARLAALADDLPGWVAAPETVVPLPPVRPRVKPAARTRRASA
jgi:hypothetical protein